MSPMGKFAYGIMAGVLNMFPAALVNAYCGADRCSSGYCNKMHVDIRDSAAKEGSHITLKSTNYPSEMPGSTTGSCSVEASCAGIVVWTVLDRRLTCGVQSGHCEQTLSIRDPKTGIVIDITCNPGTCKAGAQQRNQKPQTGSGSFFTINLTNSRTSPGGHFWIDLKAVPPGATVDVRCGDRALREPLYASCTTPPNEENSFVPAQVQWQGVQDLTSTILVLVGCVVLAACIIAVIIYCIQTRKKNVVNVFRPEND